MSKVGELNILRNEAYTELVRATQAHLEAKDAYEKAVKEAEEESKSPAEEALLRLLAQHKYNFLGCTPLHHQMFRAGVDDAIDMVMEKYSFTIPNINEYRELLKR